MKIQICKNKTSIKTLLLLILLCRTIALCAQSNYKPGYIITNERDTVFGWIDFRTDNANSKMCRFKTEENTAPTAYLPGEIAGYRFSEEGKFYVSRDITLNNSAQKVFLEYLVQGIMDLYFYSDGQQRYFFFENEAGEMNVITRKEKDNDKVDNKYKGSINYIFKDYQPIVAKVPRLKFDQRSFIGITKTYHEAVCTTGEECIVFENKHPDGSFLKFTLSPFIGINKYDFTIRYNIGEIHMVDTQPTAGLGLNIKNPRWSQSFSMQLNAYISKRNGKHKYYYADYYHGEYTYQAYLSMVDIGIKYEYPKYKLRPVAEAGFTFSKLSNLSGDLMFIENDRFIKTNIYLGVGLDYQVNKNNACIFRVFYTSYGYDMKLGYAYTF